MNDLIKREDARRFFTEFLSLNRFADFKNANIERLVSVLCERIPSAEPKRGKWIKEMNTNIVQIWKCDQCAEMVELSIRYKYPRWSWCPNCGARMK